MTSPRSGSRFLCNSLTIGGMGVIYENLSFKLTDQTKELPPLNKMFPSHRFNGKQILKNKEKFFSLVLEKYPDMKFIFLERKDKIAQITSKYYAHVIDIYHISPQETKKVIDISTYEFPNITFGTYYHLKRLFEYFLLENKKALEYAEKNNIPYIKVFCEDLIADINNWDYVLKFCDIDLSKKNSILDGMKQTYVIRDLMKKKYGKIYKTVEFFEKF